MERGRREKWGKNTTCDVCWRMPGHQTRTCIVSTDKPLVYNNVVNNHLALGFSVRLVNATSRLPLFYMECDNYGTREAEAKSLSMDSCGKRG